MDNQLCMRCYVSGKVQGVWYRSTAKEQAKKLGITGWARNLPDGRVEVFACGEEKQLEIFYNWLKKGPELALVTECTYHKLSWQEYEGFDTY
ncbi:acylphosphatase [Legionella sp.]|uniref:acylphosphatase n=1 Tax=Legionella sp. TaxID=459 RepID=UPI003CA34572